MKALAQVGEIVGPAKPLMWSSQVYWTEVCVHIGSTCTNVPRLYHHYWLSIIICDSLICTSCEKFSKIVWYLKLLHIFLFSRFLAWRHAWKLHMWWISFKHKHMVLIFQIKYYKWSVKGICWNDFAFLIRPLLLGMPDSQSPPPSLLRVLPHQTTLLPCRDP